MRLTRPSTIVQCNKRIALDSLRSASGVCVGGVRGSINVYNIANYQRHYRPDWCHIFRGSLSSTPSDLC